MKLILIGHVCSPDAGSEAGGTWNWAWHLSRHHEVSVVAHPHDRINVEKFLAHEANPQLTFHWVSLPRMMDPLHPGGDGRGLKLHYWIWLRLAYKKALMLHKEIGFDIAHHLCWGSVSAAPPFWKLPIPVVWGPLGGGQQTPASFRTYFGRNWISEVLRNARVRALHWSPSLRKTAVASRVALATNRETADVLQSLGATDVRFWLDSGIPTGFLSDRKVSSANGDLLTLLWVGRMLPRKALPLAFEALAKARDINVRLLVAGDGEMREAWTARARSLNLEDKIEFLGAVPWREMSSLYRKADAFLFTSLRDSFGMQVLEAMGHSLPILTLDHQGIATFVPPDAGIKVPVTTPRETVARIANGIRWLARNPEARQALGQAGRAFAETQTWERHGERMSNLYEEVVSAQKSSTTAAQRPSEDRCKTLVVQRHKNPLWNLRSKWRFLQTQYGFQRKPLLTIIRLFSWMARCLVQDEVVVNLRRWNVKMSLPGEWRGLGKFLFVFRENYEPELAHLGRFLSLGNTFIDVGANFGIYTLVASKLVGETGRVIAFEPTAESFERLQKNIALNNLPNVRAFRVAASDRTGSAWLHYGTDPVRNSLGKDPCCEGGGEEVAVDSLDSALRKAGVDRVDVIKIDAEGAEELVLRGATNLLGIMHPVVVYERNPEASAHLGLSERGATKLLADLGYKFRVRKQPGTTCSGRHSPGYFNMVAIPRTADSLRRPQGEFESPAMSAKRGEVEMQAAFAQQSGNAHVANGRTLPVKPIPLRSLPETPLVSILIANYNYASFLPEAIESCLHQTYARLEIVVCDDGSTDDSRRILEQYSSLDSRIKPIYLANGGQSLALNAALRSSGGEIVCLLDADDIFLPEKVELVVKAFVSDPCSGFAANQMRLVDKNRNYLGPIPSLYNLPSGWHGAFLSAEGPHILLGLPPTSGLSLRRPVAEAIFPLPAGLKAYSDSLIQVLAPLATPIAAVDSQQSEYRLHGNNVAGVGRFTESRLRNIALYQREIWMAWRRYLASPCSGLPTDFRLPTTNAPSLMDYAYARFRSDRNSKSVYQAIPRTHLQALPKPHQLYWRASVMLPCWLFRRSFDFVYGQPRLKMAARRILYACRNSFRLGKRTLRRVPPPLEGRGHLASGVSANLPSGFDPFVRSR